MQHTLPLKIKDLPASWERRAFLGKSARIACGIVCMGSVGGLIGCGSGGNGGTGQGGAPSYERGVLMDCFEGQAPYYKSAISGKNDGIVAEWVTENARVHFEKLMAEIPYVGDAQRPLPQTLIQSAVAFSFCRTLGPAGEATEPAGKLIVEAAEAGYRSVSAEEHRARGEQQFTQEWYQMQRFAAQKSMERHYAGDWVFSFVEGIPDEFDWGWDFTECGILKFYHSQGVKELVPYLCVLDFIVSKLEGTGLQRTKTLARGDDCCNFRYRKGREVQVPVH